MLLLVGVYMDMCGIRRGPAPLLAVREVPLVLWLVPHGRPVEGMASNETLSWFL